MHRPELSREALRFSPIFLAISVSSALAVAPPAPFTIGGDPSVNPAEFRVTTFATGLGHPYGMQQLSDGSLLVGTSSGGYFNSPGQLVRLVDTDGDGAADGAPTVVASNLPARLTSLRVAGDLVFASNVDGISVLRLGATPADALTPVGSVSLTFPANWEHVSYAVETRETPGQPGKRDLFFNIGAEGNATSTPTDHTVTAGGLLTGTLQGDSIYKVMVADNGGANVAFSDLTQIATGLRNAAGIKIHPTTGDLYFEDNGIDGLVNGLEPLSADELNVIPAAQIGGAIEDFGFAEDYVEYRTGNRVGAGGIEPLVAFTPIPNPANGAESEGATEIAFAPSQFPTGLNNGIFTGFFGQFSSGASNEENPLVFYDLTADKYFHLIDSNNPAIGHLNGLLSTTDSLFLADLAPTNIFNSAADGAIYQIQAIAPVTVVPVPSSLGLMIPGFGIGLLCARRLRPSLA